MRWGKRYDLKDRLGDTRTVQKFLWYPRQYGESKWRWLETANIVEKICEVDIGGPMEWGFFKYEWRGIAFTEFNHAIKEKSEMKTLLETVRDLIKEYIGVKGIDQKQMDELRGLVKWIENLLTPTAKLDESKSNEN